MKSPPALSATISPAKNLLYKEREKKKKKKSFFIARFGFELSRARPLPVWDPGQEPYAGIK